MYLKAQASEVLQELEAKDASDSRDGTPKEQRVRCITPLIGELLHLLILIARPKQILELGTSAGYSTIWMAAAAEQVGASIISVDSDPEKISWAGANIKSAALDHVVQLVSQGAMEFVNSSDCLFDFVLMDHGGRFYLETFKAVRNKISLGGCVLVDGWKSVETWSTDYGLLAYRECVMQDTAFRSLLLPVEKGMMISTRILPPPQ